MIPEGYSDVAPGKIAAVVTHLEMLTPPPNRPSESIALRRVQNPDLEWYRKIFRRTGEQWLWWSRLEMADEQLSAILNAPTTELFIALHERAEVGMAELDRSRPGNVEITFFGLFAEAIGKRLGRPFLETLLDRAWAGSTSRVFVHTCTLDSPSALPLYTKCGFRAYKRAIEIADDPRLRGLLPKGAAPQVPIIA